MLITLDRRDLELLRLTTQGKVILSRGLCRADNHRRETGEKLARLKAAGLIAVQGFAGGPTRHLTLTDRGRKALENA